MTKKAKGKLLMLVMVAGVVLAALIVNGSASKKLVSASTLSDPSFLEPKQTVNGFSVELKSLSRKDASVRAEFCYALPTEEDWQIMGMNNVTLSTYEETYAISRGKISVAESPVNGKGKKRCTYVFFDVPMEKELSEVTIQVHRVFTSLPEFLDCDKAQKKLSNSNKGKEIIVKCRNEDHSAGFDVEKKPFDMTLVEARKIAEEEGFSTTIYGPWTFKTFIK